jgi:6-pyruvoyltetrahydropterin/6-carboxytetrahydropterin synthase
MKRNIYIVRREAFCSAHRLYSNFLTKEENLKRFDKCTNVHGHNYELFVTLKGRVDMNDGLFINLTDVKKIIVETVVNSVDHKYLNEIPPFTDIPPTAENMAIVFWDWLKPHFPEGLLYEIKLVETENNIAIYKGD